ncbi:uncharacterized protein [Ptychodera flava]|uniref:uncharacterized protein n=1 Tax=Ptychodera flava TaxID=63121 RepID=UPI003969E937
MTEILVDKQWCVRVEFTGPVTGAENLSDFWESEVVRLVGGETPYEGRVEMFINGQWLPVLYNGPPGRGMHSWSFPDADILCNELGYNGAMYHGSSDKLSGDPRRRITNIWCDESDESLLDCRFNVYDYFAPERAATVKCNLLVCPLLPGRKDGCPYLIGDTVSITCKIGFKFSIPNHAVKCQQDATWNGTLPRCIAIDCGNPGEVENADRIGTQYSYNSTVIYTCHDGYYTNGSGTIRCTIEGRWTEKPSCFFNDTQLSESVTTSHAGWAIGVSLGVVTAILIGLALIIFLMRRKIRLKFRNALGSSSAIQDEVVYCNEPERRNNIRREGAVNSENLKVISEDDGYTSVDTDQTEDHGCIDKHTGVKMLVKPLAQYETSKQNGTKVDIMLQNDKIRSNKYEDESQRYDNMIIGEKVGERSFTCDSGSVENVAYESADINDDDGDVYTAIDEDGDVSMADNVDVGLVHHTARNDGEGTVDNIAYETVDSIDHGRPAYAVRDGT